jgi:hypothetical protein
MLPKVSGPFRARRKITGLLWVERHARRWNTRGYTMIHFDVAAYALGRLDERDSEHFEEHLIDCDACARELEELIPVVEFLSHADPGIVIADTNPGRHGVPLQREKRGGPAVAPRDPRYPCTSTGSGLARG